jgi:hypothetical protein
MDAKTRAKKSLLGQNHRVVTCCHDNKDTSYFIYAESDYLRLIDTKTGRVIFNCAKERQSNLLEEVFVIHRFSDNIHIVGIYEDTPERLADKEDEYWSKPVGFDLYIFGVDRMSVYPTCNYNQIYLCIGKETHRLAQFKALGNLLVIDIMREHWEMDINGTVTNEMETFVRKIIKISNREQISISKVCKYKTISDDYRVETVEIPSTYFFPEGVVILSQEALWKLRGEKKFLIYVELVIDTTVVGLEGNIQYKGKCRVNVSIDQLYYMDVTHNNPAYTPWMGIES